MFEQLKGFFTQNVTKDDSTVDSPSQEKKSVSLLNTYNSRGQKTTISKSERLELYKGWVYGTVNLIGNNFAEVPLRLYTPNSNSNSKIVNFSTNPVNPIQKRFLNTKAISTQLGGSANLEVIYNHPAQELLQSVNSYMDYFGLMYLSEIWIDLIGDCFWYIPKDKSGVPQEIHILDPRRMSILVNDKQTEVKGYAYKSQQKDNSEKMVVFKVDEICHFSNPTPNSRFYGDSPLAALATSISKISLSNRLETSVLQNNGMPLVLLKSDSELTPEQIRSVEMQFQKATGNGRQGGVKVLDSRFEFEQVQYSLADLMLTDSQTFDLKQIAFAYGVPYGFMDTSDQMKAGLDNLKELFAKNCLIPRLTRMEEALNQQYLKNVWGLDGLMFAFDDVTPENEERNAKIITEYVKNGIITVDEARTIVGM